MLKSLKIPVEKLKAKEIDSVKERVTCLKWELGHTPALEDIKAAIQAGFAQELGVDFKPAGLTAEEEDLFNNKLDYYQSSEWIDYVKPKFKRSEVIQAAYKADAGMVRFTLVVALPRKKIKNIFITGDFLSFPTRALFDLESRLRGLRIERRLLHDSIKQFFNEGRICIPGMGYRDFIKPLDQAIEKIEINAFDIPLELCNQISVCNDSFREIVAKKPSVLLLPYCAKDKECDLRYKKGCRACGDCSTGAASTMGRQKKMKVVSITSFEDLMNELHKMKKAGVSAFIGCCCRPFFNKHADDFERAGVPGILLEIDSTTCYELDQTKQAYAGTFESQTHLNLDLLNTVLSVAR